MIINPIRATDQKLSNDQQTIRLNSQQTPSIQDNGVDTSAQPNTYVERKDTVSLNYDVERYVQMLKNKVIPPADRVDASILLELELGGDITAQEVKQMLDEVERNDMRKESAKVNQESTDADSRGKEA